MAEKKISIVFLIILLCGLLLLSIFGCASAAPREDSNHYVAAAQVQPQGKPYQGPKVFGRGYYSDIKHGSKFDHSVKNTWKVSPDGSSGSMSQTFIRTYEHTTKGEHGTMIGPAGLGALWRILRKGEKNEEIFASIYGFVLFFYDCANN